MVKVMYNDKLVYKVVIWVVFLISLWQEKVALTVKHLWILHKMCYIIELLLS